jgi:hypothetical protein
MKRAADEAAPWAPWRPTRIAGALAGVAGDPLVSQYGRFEGPDDRKGRPVALFFEDRAGCAQTVGLDKGDRALCNGSRSRCGAGKRPR